MAMQTVITVIGMKPSKGVLDNGQPYDSTKMFYLVDLDTRKGEAIGQGADVENIGDSTEFQKYKHLRCPFQATADVDIVTSGNTKKLVYSNIRPIANQSPSPVSPAKPAAA